MAAFITDKRELRRGLIIFRRGDLQHREWYCRVKVPKTRRYKTVALKTIDIETAQERAYDHFADVKAKVQNDLPVFNRPFRDVAQEYLATQQQRADHTKISRGRPQKMKAVIEGALDAYVGSRQVDLIGDELWADYPVWRREHGEGRSARNGTRRVTRELAVKLVQQDQTMKEKAWIARRIRPKKLSAEDFETAVEAKLKNPVPLISDATISFEMAIFGAIMNYAIKKRYAPVSQRFDNRPKLQRMRRDEFTLEEYRRLHTKGRKWIRVSIKKDKEGKDKEVDNNDVARWYRTVTYNMILIACNTGMRPSELKNLCWGDIETAKDREGREIVVLTVRGKGKTRKLVAAKSVGEYLDRVRGEVRRAKRQRAGKEDKQNIDRPDEDFEPGPNDPVFSTINGKPAQSLYKHLIEDLLTFANLRQKQGGPVRSTYSFRHTYATMRLQEGVDSLLLADQMGTSGKMIQDHYGHVNTVSHAERVLMGVSGWDTVNKKLDAEAAEEESKAKATAAAKAKQSGKPRRLKR